LYFYFPEHFLRDFFVMKMNYLVIEGNIGAGKTSLVNRLADELGGKAILEGFADNPFLPKFYKNPDQYAFPLEMSFMADRYKQLSKHIPSLEADDRLVISDYYFMKSLIFAKNTLTADEFLLYQRFFDIIYEKIPKPDLYVFLNSDINKLLVNIKKRGRSYEQGIDDAYLEKISSSYLNFLEQQTDFPVLIIDTNKIDFVSKEDDYKTIERLIFETEHLPGINRVFPD